MKSLLMSINISPHRAAELTLKVKQISQSSTYLKLILILGKRKADPKINKSIKTTKAQDSNPSPVEFLEIFYCIVRLMHVKGMFPCINHMQLQT